MENSVSTAEVKAVGGWSSFGVVTEADYEVFTKAMHNIIGVDYTPLEVSTQVVNGVNYRFYCDSKIPMPGATSQKAMVHIYQPIDGKPVVTRITMEDQDLSEDAIAGGWSSWHALDKESMAVFTEATEGLLGVTYTPLEVSTQVVAGMNYRYRCNAEVISKEHDNYRVIMEIFKPLTGDAIITHMERIK